MPQILARETHESGKAVIDDIRKHVEDDPDEVSQALSILTKDIILRGRFKRKDMTKCISWEWKKGAAQGGALQQLITRFSQRIELDKYLIILMEVDLRIACRQGDAIYHYLTD
jgi:hypothetical protein